MQQKTGRPNDRKPHEWQRDLNPDPMAGKNVGLDASQSEKNAPTAYAIEDLNRNLSDFTDGELRRIPVLPPGA